MVIFIGNLPVQATEAGMCELARLPAGTHLRVIKKRSRDGEPVRFALVQVDDARQARKLIARLQGRTCHGHKLVVREYQPRVAGNERRRVNWRQLPWDGEERRWEERRSMITEGAALNTASVAA